MIWCGTHAPCGYFAALSAVCSSTISGRFISRFFAASHTL